MRTTEDRRTWFGLGKRPTLPDHLRTGKGQRLKGLEEFVPPEFVGRMARIERRRLWAFRVSLVVAVGVGVGIGLIAFGT